jgi:hypothetical protein
MWYLQGRWEKGQDSRQAMTAAAMEVRQKAKEEKRTAVPETKAAMSKLSRRHMTSTRGRNRWVVMSRKLIHATKGGWSRNSTTKNCQ